MAERGEYREIFRRAGQRWLEGDSAAISEFERGIGVALDQGDMAAALAAHQRLLAWRPGEAELHRRVARAIAAARDRAARGSLSGLPALESAALFSGVPREELESILAAAAPVHVAPGSVVVREGEPGDSLFLIVHGRLRVSTAAFGDELALAELSGGEFFGEVSLTTGRPRTATVTAEEPTELLRLDRKTVDELRRRHPSIDASLAEFHRRRAERTIEALIERRARG